MSIGMKDVAKAYEEEHGYYLEGPLPIWGEHRVGKENDSGDVVVKNVTGIGTQTVKDATKGAKQLYVAVAVILVLVIVAGIVT